MEAEGREIDIVEDASAMTHENLTTDLFELVVLTGLKVADLETDSGQPRQSLGFARDGGRALFHRAEHAIEELSGDRHGPIILPGLRRATGLNCRLHTVGRGYAKQMEGVAERDARAEKQAGTRGCDVFLVDQHAALCVEGVERLRQLMAVGAELVRLQPRRRQRNDFGKLCDLVDEGELGRMRERRQRVDAPKGRPNRSASRRMPLIRA